MSDWDVIEVFAKLNKAGYASPATPRGRDIMAACGQLRSESRKIVASHLPGRKRLIAVNNNVKVLINQAHALLIDGMVRHIERIHSNSPSLGFSMILHDGHS
jgi:hypothetical protein